MCACLWSAALSDFGALVLMTGCNSTQQHAPNLESQPQALHTRKGLPWCTVTNGTKNKERTCRTGTDSVGQQEHLVDLCSCSMQGYCCHGSGSEPGLRASPAMTGTHRLGKVGPKYLSGWPRLAQHRPRTQTLDACAGMGCCVVIDADSTVHSSYLSFAAVFGV